jgi:exonuclease III
MSKILVLFFTFVFFLGHSQDTLSICSFNIQFLGHFQTRENAILAEIVKDNDIVVVQEMVAAPIAGVYPDGTAYQKDKESAAFVDEMKKRGFSYWMSNEDTGPTKNHTPTPASEWWIVFYKSKTVQPDSVNRFYGFISDPKIKNTTFQRVPYAFPFKAVNGKSNFTLISVHLQPGDSSDEKLVRQRELKGLFDWVSSQTEKNKDYYVLGDCNIYKQDEFISYNEKGFWSLNEKCLNTNSSLYRGPTKGYPYDHVFYGTSSKEDLILNSFEVVDLKQEIVEHSEPGQFNLEPYVHDYFRTKFSDHLPVTFKLVTGRDKDL